jgi:gliding motility-associated-like protein
LFLRILIIFLLFLNAGSSRAQIIGFVPNEGQWSGNYDFFLAQGHQSLFFRADEVRVRLTQPQVLDHSHHGHSILKTKEPSLGHVFAWQWLGTNKPKAIFTKAYQGAAPLNFIMGKDPQRWRSQVPQFSEIIYRDIYDGIDIRYYLTETGVYHYDFIVKPRADPQQIKWRIRGADTSGIINEDLVVATSVQNAIYSAPRAFSSGQNPVPCLFEKNHAGEYFFQVGDYSNEDTLIIDPTLVFSTYSGATDDNFGFSATYGEGGTAFGAGISFVFGSGRTGYPVTLGAFQDSSQGGAVDVVISKYNARGTQQLYATYLGGSNNDVPYSLLEGPNRSLIVLGITGSPDFPVTATAFDTSFNVGRADTLNVGGVPPMVFGSDIFLTVLDSVGGALLGSTFLGDTLPDGNNRNLEFNYGDPARGDLALDGQGNILGVSYTFSPNFPTGAGTGDITYGGAQDGVVFSFNSDLSQLNWASFVGGSSNDAVFSLRYTAQSQLFITGATESPSLPYSFNGVHRSSPIGKVDGFVAEMDPNNGSFLNFTYTGTVEDDIPFFLDVDSAGVVTIFGQTFGSWPMQPAGVWGQPGSAQFIQQFNPGLSNVIRSTTFGNGSNWATNISPTALLVSECRDVFISGWGQSYNTRRGQMGRTFGLTTSPNAYRDSTDGRDFYFLHLDASWQNLRYATFFGQVGGGGDHVDGGSSRFRKDGSIFQAVCAGCGGRNTFPTTDSAFSRVNNSPNCNMAVLRFDLEADTIVADVIKRVGVPDSACLPFSVSFEDRSVNADLVLVLSPDGALDTLISQSFSITDSGESRFNFVALDTNCNLADTVSLSFFGLNKPVRAQFEQQYDTCDGSATVSLQNQSQGANRYRWFFGDGDSSNLVNPSHVYAPGRYQITLVATDTVCGKTDTVRSTVNISNRQNRFDLYSIYDPCDPDQQVELIQRSNGFQLFEWYQDDLLLATSSTDTFKIDVRQTGPVTLRVVALDTICQRSSEEEVEIMLYASEDSLLFPNVFTPNGDGLNDLFKPLGLELASLDFIPQYNLAVYDRRGALIHRSSVNRPFWDGKFENSDMPEGVYFYIFDYRDICGNFNKQRGFVHLNR